MAPPPPQEDPPTGWLWREKPARKQKKLNHRADRRGFVFVNIQISLVRSAGHTQVGGRACWCLELTSAAGTPSGGRQCRTIMPLMGTSLPWGSCSKFFLRSAGDQTQLGYAGRTWTRLRPLACPRGGLQEALKRRRSNRLHTDRSDLTASSKLTGDADRCLATLGGSQVAPGHTQAPVVLRAVEVLHLLAGHVDQDFTHLQT